MKIKRGDTLVFTISVKDSDGEMIDLETTQINSQMRTSNGKLIDTFLVEETDTAGKFTLSATEDTKTYPIGIMNIDIELIIDGSISSTNTFTLEIEKDITREEEEG